MAQLSKKKKKNIFIIVVTAILLIGILCFVLGYGFSQGWEVVGWFFTSKYGVTLYICLGLYALLVTWIVLYDKLKKTY